MRSKKENVLLLAKKNKKTKKLEDHLADYFYEVRLVSDSSEMGMLPSNNHFAVIIVTDSFGLKQNKDFFLYLRNEYPHAKMLCLFDEISQGMETAIRSAGPVFLGSYDQFFRFSIDILQSAVESKIRT